MESLGTLFKQFRGPHEKNSTISRQFEGLKCLRLPNYDERLELHDNVVLEVLQQNGLGFRVARPLILGKWLWGIV